MDKREAVRVPVRMHALCRAHDEVFDGTVEDISRSGLLFCAPHRARPGDVAEIQIEVGGEPLRLAAEVVRVMIEPREAMALRFVGQTEGTRRPLANLIMQCHATR